MLLIVYSVFMVLLLFGVTVFVHELGHFLVARWCGMVVDVFSIGFGPALYRKKVGDITYKIGCIPFGGYVALPQMDSTGEVSAPNQDGKKRDLPQVPPWKRMLVAFAGVTGNMILAVILAYVVYWGGSSYAPPETACRIGFVETNCAAYAQGIRQGDIIEAVNGRSVKSWQDFAVNAALIENTAPLNQAELMILSADGQPRTVAVETEEVFGTRMVAGLSPVNFCYVLKVEPGSSAEAAGLQRGDKIVRFGGVDLLSRDHLIALVNQARDLPTSAEIERDGRAVEVEVTPRYNADIGRAVMGIAFNTFDIQPPLEQIKSHASLLFRLLKALVTPKEARNAASAVGGPVMIFQLFWIYVQTSLIMALWFTGLLNVNLAIVNLLPLPVLDGGHIVFCAWEMITRRPVHPKVMNALVNVFVVLLIALFLFLSYRDIVRSIGFFSKRGGEPTELSTNAPAPPQPDSPR